MFRIKIGILARIGVIMMLTSFSVSQASRSLPSFVASVSGSRTSFRPSQLAMAVPIVDEWKIDRRGRLIGVVTNHPSIDDGDVITTSSLADPKSAKAQGVVETTSGSKYKLGTPINPPKNGKAVERVSKATALSNEKLGEREIKVTLKQAKAKYGLTGESVGDGRYLLSGRPKRSTSGKSNIWTGYKADNQGLPTGEALTIKISPNKEAMRRECSNYKKVTNGINRGKFTKFYEFLEVAGSTKGLTKQCALVIEKGDQDVKSLFTSRMGKGFSGKELRNAAACAAQCLQAMHASNLIWTDMKAENFVALETDKGIVIKGIDLESAMPVRDNPVDYSPEACPPEFAEALLKGDGAYFVLDYSYDVWSFGMLLYELSTGRAFFDNKNPAQITKILKTPGYEVEVTGISDDKLCDLIQQCLNRDPKKRPSVTQILLHPYFLSTGIGPFSF